MKKMFILAALLSVTALSCSADDKQQEPKQAADKASEQPVDIKKVSQAFGNFIGRHLKHPNFSFDIDALVQGIRDGAAGKPSPMNDQEYEAAMMQLQEEVFKKMSTENLDAANKFLAENAKKPGVVVLEDGKLQYRIDKEGTGTAVTETSHPEIRYTGRLLNGETFGSSEQTGTVTLNLNQTIPGFRHGLIGMKEGEKRTLWIHPDLAYGVMGQLPPNSLLTFDVELVKADAKPDDEDDISLEELMIEQEDVD